MFFMKVNHLGYKSFISRKYFLIFAMPEIIEWFRHMSIVEDCMLTSTCHLVICVSG